MLQGRARSRLTALMVVSLSMLVCAASPAWAAPGAVQDLPGCDTPLDANDDDSTGAVDLGFTATFGDLTADQVYVNNNGNLTFGEPLSDYTPYDFRGSSLPMIAPYFADVDTTGTGSVTYGQVTYDGRPAFCATWHAVGYYSAEIEPVNTFQVIIVDEGAAGVRLVFGYDSIRWETGDVDGGTHGLGGTSATAGYSTGDGNAATAYLFPGSFANGALLDGGPHSLAAGHTAGQPAGRYVFTIGPAQGARLSGDVLAPAADGGDPQPSAPVQICREGGACITRITDASGHYRASGLPAGTYDLTAFAGEGTPYSSGSATLTLAEEAVQTMDVTLGPAPQPPPTGTTITSIDTSPDGIPVAYWTDPLTLTTHGCPDGTAGYTASVGTTVRTGTLTERVPGEYTATIPAFYPEHGNAEVAVHIECPGGAPAEDVDFGLYIDPSGIVRDAAGHPAADAQVELLRSTTPDGPFFPVPDGSTVMSPSNRSNPVVTGDDGRFAWDVVAGYYVVRATRDDCVAQSAVLTIPPPVTNLDLRLACPAPPPPDGSGGNTTPPPPHGAGPVVVTPPPDTTTAPKPRKLAALKSAKLVRGRTLVVRVACRRTATRACKGSVRVRIGKRTVGRRKFAKITRGRTATVRVRLNRKGRRLVHRHARLRLSVAVTVRDRSGTGMPLHRTLRLHRHG